jgi:molybdate transport repressor ModE-like protein
MLSFERLRALHAIAVHGSVSRAAKALHVTNSAISQQIAKLEEQVGESLLERSGRGVKLTDAAALLVSHTGQMLSILEGAEAELDEHRETIVGELKVAAFSTAIRGLAPHAFRLLQKSHLKLTVILVEREPQGALALLERGDVDMVVATDWLNAPLPLGRGLSKVPLMEDVADIAVPLGHRLASRKEVNLADLAHEEWVAWHRGSICHDWLVHTLRASGHEPHVSHMVEEHATQLALVAAGCGVCVIPRLGRDPTPKRVKIVPVKPALRRHVFAVWRDGNTRRRAIAVAIEAFRAAVALAVC